MPYRFRRRETVEAGVRRIAAEQTERALAAIDDHRLGPHETVHQLRQRCKKIRGLLRIVRPQLGDTYKQENASFRKAAAGLSALRDAQSMLTCFDKLTKDQLTKKSHQRQLSDRRQVSRARKLLVQRRNEIAEQDGDMDQQLRKFRKKMRKALSRIEDWSIAADEFDALAGGFEKTFTRAREALHQACTQPSTENFHEWRKHAKYHGYHSRLLRGIWPDVMDAYRETIDQLSDLLGDDHDLANVRAFLLDKHSAAGSDEEFAEIIRLIDCRRSQLQQSARSLGLRLFIHEPAEMTDWFSNCWSVWRNGKQARGQFAVRSWAPAIPN